MTVLRDGRTITTLPTRELTEDSMVSYMVGRDLLDRFPRKEHQPGEVMLELKNWSVVNPDNPGKMLIDHVDLVARKGEILGIIGLMGAGRTELALSLLGEYTHTPDSELYLDGKRVAPKDPKQAIDCGTHMLYIALVTEARKLSDAPSMTYAYYFANVKPKPQPKPAEAKPRRGFVCRICGYFYEGGELPPDFICPLCKHGAADFEPVGF